MKILSKSNIKTILRLIYCRRDNINVPYNFKDGYTDKILPMNRFSIEHVVPKCYLPDKRLWDLNNLLVVDKDLNNFRSNTRFGQIHLKNLSFCPPCKQSRGTVSRICAHMLYTCPVLDQKLIIDKETMFRWNEKYPVTDLERQRNYLIYIYQGTYNKFIDNNNNF